MRAVPKGSPTGALGTDDKVAQGLAPNRRMVHRSSCASLPFVGRCGHREAVASISLAGVAALKAALSTKVLMPFRRDFLTYS